MTRRGGTSPGQGDRAVMIEDAAGGCDVTAMILRRCRRIMEETCWDLEAGVTAGCWRREASAAKAWACTPEEVQHLAILLPSPASPGAPGMFRRKFLGRMVDFERGDALPPFRLPAPGSGSEGGVETRQDGEGRSQTRPMAPWRGRRPSVPSARPGRRPGPGRGFPHLASDPLRGQELHQNSAFPNVTGFLRGGSYLAE